MPNSQNQKFNFDNQDTLPILADKLVSETRKLLSEVKTEEDLRIGFEKLLDPIRIKLNLKATPKYEKKTIFSGRSDAVHGQVIIEYESPRSFSSQRNIEHAFEQLVNYLIGESKESKLTKLVGVGFDGEQIFFVRYQDKENKTIDKTKFILQGPYDFSPESSRTFLIHLRALSRIPLTAENLDLKFGPQSALASKAVSALANALEYWGKKESGANKACDVFFQEWKRLFGIVYGESFASYQEKEPQTLLKLYKVGKKIDFQELLFCLHTYFAFLMKLIAAELLTLRETSFSSTLTYELAHISEIELKRQLEDIENGGIYARKGITNFLEGDFFRWYLDVFESPELKDAIREIARTLSEFEPATSILDPNSTRDLLKKLYQYLVPKEVRHRLGEYYTPDWLAELLLNEVGYNGNTLKRFLDPACGSGTFLVLAIQRAKAHGKKEKWPSLEIAKRIVANIWGFDLNPLAVIAARTNYLFALGDLANELQDFEIPIYLADSVSWPKKRQMALSPVGESIEFQTSVGPFFVPKIWVKNKGFLMKYAAPLVEKYAKNGYEPEIVMKHFKDNGLVFPPNEQIVENFYKDILELEKQNKNGIWARFLKNLSAPLVAGEDKFDFVVGNPPWIRWDYLSQDYRKATLQLWKDYGLFSLKGFKTRLGGGKKDFSMLFVYASSDYYLKDRGKLGFLITQEVFKSKGAGEGFRRFQLGDKEYLKVLKAHDLVSVQPFEGAANKTAVIILKKDKKTKYPVSYNIWTRKKGVGKIATNMPLGEVLPLLMKKKYNAKPIGSSVGSWQTQPMEIEDLSVIEGKNSYKAILGANPNPYGVFWLEIKKIQSDGIIIRNLTEKGKLKIPQVEIKIEQDLVYPAIRGSDIKRWIIQPQIFMLVVQDPKTRRGYAEDFMKKNYSRTYSYLLEFKDILLSRPLYKKYHEQVKAPFYSQFNISEKTFSNYKVVWKRMTNDLISTVISQHKTPYGFKTIIPLETTALISTNNEPEAHYLCAIINSNPVRDFIKSFSSAGRGFGTPSVMEHVGIPKFDPQNEIHQQLSEISQKCHQLKLEGKEKEIYELEKENDEQVKKLFSSKGEKSA